MTMHHTNALSHGTARWQRLRRGHTAAAQKLVERRILEKEQWHTQSHSHHRLAQRDHRTEIFLRNLIGSCDLMLSCCILILLWKIAIFNQISHTSRTAPPSTEH